VWAIHGPSAGVARSGGSRVCGQSALEAIYDACFVQFNQYAQTQLRPQQQKFEGAQTGNFSAASMKLAIGAANGVLPDGSPEDPDGTHQLEVWTGINFGLAAFLAQMGMTDQAMAIAEAVVQSDLSLWPAIPHPRGDYGPGHLSGLPLHASPGDLGVVRFIERGLRRWGIYQHFLRLTCYRWASQLFSGNIPTDSQWRRFGLRP
jgi:hypothetical protein